MYIMGCFITTLVCKNLPHERNTAKAPCKMNTDFRSYKGQSFDHIHLQNNTCTL